jgi:hypothetical protein
MSPLLEKKFTEIERQRKEIFDWVRNVSVDQINESPAPGKWSLAQIYTHLYVAEKLSVSYMKKKSLGLKSLASTTVLDDLKFLFLTISQRIPVKYKAPPIVLQHTPTPVPITDLEKEWDRLRQELKQLVETFDDTDVYRKVYKHALMGRLNVLQAMSFFKEHIIHHTPQIKRLL